MKDDALLAWPDGFAEELEEAVPAGLYAPQARLAPPPPDREAILAESGPGRLPVYLLVRACINDFERIAPWKLLYYPPEDPAQLLGMIIALMDTIRGIPKRVDAVLHTLPEEGAVGDDEPTREDASFLFHGIHHMVANDLKRLETALLPLRSGNGALPTPAEGTNLCEIAADLKGKYSSAMMGAAASLVGQGVWNGVELEPILFPEKGEEFRSTRELVDMMREATEAIQKLPEQLPFASLIERWRQKERVDQYSLAELPSLRGKLGRLLQERNRRALYSGDYHQISRREMLLSDRVQELERLHQQTWTLPRDAAELEPVYARLEQLLLEIAAVLDANLLKTLLGEKKVNDLRARSAMAKGKPAASAAGLDSLLPLLAEDDLRIYFELLLGAVLRRACLTVPPPAPEPAPLPAPEPVRTAAPAAATKPAPKPKPAAAAPVFDQAATLAKVNRILVDLMSVTNPNLSAYKMTQRLLAKHTRIPDAMFQSIYPYLEEVRGKLVPALRPLVPYKGVTEDVVNRLEAFCSDLLRVDPTPERLKDEIPRKLDRLPRFLEAVRSVVPQS
jgi:hypothetical protein